MTLSPGQRIDDERDVAEVREVLDHLARAYYERDLEAAVSPALYQDVPPAEPFVLYDWTPPTQLAGLQVFRERAEQFFASSEGPLLTEWSDTHISVVGDMAYFRGLWNVRFHLKDDPAEHQVSMRETLVLRRIDGTFKIVHEHCSIPAQEFVY